MINKKDHSNFSQQDLEYAEAISNQIAIAIHNIQLNNAAIKAERLAAIGVAVTSVAHCKRGPHRAANNLHRVVPRHDMARDAVRFAEGIDRVAVEIGDGLTHHLIRGAPVKLHVTGERCRIGAGLGQRLAHVFCFQ